MGGSKTHTGGKEGRKKKWTVGHQIHERKRDLVYFSGRVTMLQRDGCTAVAQSLELSTDVGPVVLAVAGSIPSAD